MSFARDRAPRSVARRRGIGRQGRRGGPCADGSRLADRVGTEAAAWKAAKEDVDSTEGEPAGAAISDGEGPPRRESRTVARTKTTAPTPAPATSAGRLGVRVGCLSVGGETAILERSDSVSLDLFVAGLDAHGDTVIDELSLAGDPLVLVVGSEGRACPGWWRSAATCWPVFPSRRRPSC